MRHVNQIMSMASVFLRFLAKEECSFNLSGYVCKFVTQLVKGRREKYSVCGGKGVDRRAVGG